MVSISFQRKFLDDLLSDRKQQTTRRQTDRFKVGAVAQLYLEQRRRIIDKPILQLTGIGTTAMADRVQDPAYNYPAECPVVSISSPYELPYYYAHFLGKVEITEVYEILPCRMPKKDLEVWANRDGFRNFIDADVWFTDHYDEYWINLKWTVERWDGWLERYFNPGEI